MPQMDNDGWTNFDFMSSADTASEAELKASGHMAQGKQQPKFERNPCNNYQR